jgi:hypothetical protein
MISTASYPAFWARPAACAKWLAVRSTPRVLSADGLNGVIGDFFADALTLNGW